MLWQKITESMQRYGYNITLIQVENKYKSLERSYKNMILNNNKTGRARISCPYETQLTELMGHRHNIRPLAVSGKQSLLLREDVQINKSLKSN
ncbi:trihelix transcription factor GT-2-like [Monomorium pharaonis]|uniref:trihelix transcription factor GT-2-like n=1 Tax=Monomorium pharaonis TaxID=307658 RepID=UPI0017475786|nr:trihelix transcription factor GT-2-like [Monomorium pharaonis]